MDILKICKLLKCPKCSGKLIYSEIGLSCEGCDGKFDIKNNKIFFNKNFDYYGDKKSFFISLREKIKQNNFLYKFLLHILSPIYQSKEGNGLFKKVFKANNKSILLNLGSGNTGFLNSINIDFIPYKKVDIVNDIMNIPFADESADGVICKVTVEHLAEPDKLINEVYRILKKNGIIYFTIPFLVGYHSVPDDYNRWTEQGIRNLFKDFKEIKIGIKGGPASSLCWILQEFFALLFCFNNEKLYNLFKFSLLFLLWPIKFLDIFLNKYEFSKNAAAVFYYIGRKE